MDYRHDEKRKDEDGAVETEIVLDIFLLERVIKEGHLFVHRRTASLFIREGGEKGNTEMETMFATTKVLR